MVRFLSIVLISLSLSGCWWNRPPPTTPVYIPVPVQVEVPDELKDRYRIQEDVIFISPMDESAVAALDKEGIREFQLMVINLLNRLRLWESYYLED